MTNKIKQDSVLVHRATLQDGLQAILKTCERMGNLAKPGEYEGGYIQGCFDTLDQIATLTGVEISRPQLTLQGGE